MMSGIRLISNVELVFLHCSFGRSGYKDEADEKKTNTPTENTPSLHFSNLNLRILSIKVSSSSYFVMVYQRYVFAFYTKC